MVFSSPIFLFYFLPAVLVLHFLLKNNSLRNIFLLLVSLMFYAWGELFYCLLMICSIVFNYYIGKRIGSLQEKDKKTTTILLIGVLINIGSLAYFKYSNFLFESIQSIGMLTEYMMLPVHLPIGISFFTFQSISYLVDVSNKTVKPQNNPLELGLYISLFPQLIAGPIIRYQDIIKQIKKRSVEQDLFVSGIKKFTIGLSKKVIIADTLAPFVDNLFLMDPSEIPAGIAWLGIICYSLQIYYDFSGYSDMAIGIGRMLGFRILENFNFPYISTSIKEFWRRWHISLSTWFRDYLYIPLGGNRKSKTRTYFNLITVFFITGLWHGAGWNFIIWGLFHGLFLILERIGLDKILNRIPKILRSIYTLFIVLVGWIFFKANTLEYGFEYLLAMFTQSSVANFKSIMDIEFFQLCIFVIALVLCYPFGQLFSKKSMIYKFGLPEISTLLLMVFCILQVASSSYSPFIYFRF